MTYTREFVEKEYNNRAMVPTHADYFARWEKDSQFVRETLPGHLDLAYGPHARHRMDLFSAGKSARGTLLFIHGGYWRSLDKNLFSWLAAAWCAAGVNVAMPAYRLAPEVGIGDIVDDIIDATNWLAENGARYGVPMDKLVVTGHSAGGHLTAALFAAPRDRLRFDPARIAGGVPFSGIFDFEPMLHYAFNADFKLDETSARHLSPLDKARTVSARIVPVAGGNESSEFQRQSRLLGEKWSPQSTAALILPGLDHFSIVDSFAERGQPLYEATLALF